MTDWTPDRSLPGEDPGGRPSTAGRGLPDGESVLHGDPSPSEVFQRLASEERVRVLVELLDAEQTGRLPCSFTELQRAAGSDSSAGFAYHLRQLSGHFVRKDGDGYVLTPAGRRAAQAVVNGTFTNAEAVPNGDSSTPAS